MLKRVSVKLILFLSFVFLYEEAFGFGVFLPNSWNGGGTLHDSFVYNNYGTIYGIEISQDKRNIRFYMEQPCLYTPTMTVYTEPWLTIGADGVSEVSYYCFGPITSYDITYKLEMKGTQIRFISINSITNSVRAGKWVDMCSGATSQKTGDGFIYLDINPQTKSARICVYLWVINQYVCGNRVEYVCGPSCPSGYTYNPQRNICEAEPEYSYTCPSGNYACVEESPGTAYCSPYNCSNSVNGTPYCMSGPITSAITENTVGMWWCSGDQTWLQTEAECFKNCPYYDCSLDGKRYTGLTTCQNACRRQHSCEVY